jgi:hypothetical protein
VTREGSGPELVRSATTKAPEVGPPRKLPLLPVLRSWVLLEDCFAPAAKNETRRVPLDKSCRGRGAGTALLLLRICGC